MISRNVKIFAGTAIIATAAVLFLSWRRKAATVISQFIGIKEIGNNQSFSDPAFQQMMKTVGWRNGESWCAYLVKAVYLKAFPKKAAALEKILSPSTQQTLKNAREYPELLKVLDQSGDKAQVGDMVIWRSTKNPALGHTGIVESKKDNGWTVEGNTSLQGVREGQGVEHLKRKLEIGAVMGDLELIAFIRLKNDIL